MITNTSKHISGPCAHLSALINSNMHHPTPPSLPSVGGPSRGPAPPAAAPAKRPFWLGHRYLVDPHRPPRP